MTVEIDIAVSSPARLGEGAVWDTEDACLWWVDIKAGLIHRFDPATGVNNSFNFGQPVTISRPQQISQALMCWAAAQNSSGSAGITW